MDGLQSQTDSSNHGFSLHHACYHSVAYMHMCAQVLVHVVAGARKWWYT